MKTTTTTRSLLFALSWGVGLLLFSSILHAQDLPVEDEGRVRIQGQDLIEEEIIDLTPSGPLVDFREEMRTFVQNISRFARRYRSDFSVIIEDALPLVIKTNVSDDTLTDNAGAHVYPFYSGDHGDWFVLWHTGVC